MRTMKRCWPITCSTQRPAPQNSGRSERTDDRGCKVGLLRRRRRTSVIPFHSVAIASVLVSSLVLWSALTLVSGVCGSTGQSLAVDQPEVVVVDEDALNNSLELRMAAAAEERGARNRRHCPSCKLMTGIHDGIHRGEEKQREDSMLQQQHEQTSTGDSARLESIKRQILVKLGLGAKPNLLATAPPRDFILETLLRAEESTVAAAPSSSGGKQHHYHHHQQATSGDAENGVEDDFYGRTSEIIAFGEPGPTRLNGQVLAEFSRAQETTPESNLRVKSATLWIYVRLKLAASISWTSSSSSSLHNVGKHIHQRQNRRPPTLYVFRLLSHPTNVSLDKNWNELLASQRVTIQHSGWMKINITEGVRKWFSAPASSSSSSMTINNNKLRLLVDCSGCGSDVEPVLFSSSSPVAEGHKNQDGTKNTKKKKKKKRRKRRRRRLVDDDEQQQVDDVLLRDDVTGGYNQEDEHKARNRHQQQQQQRPFIVIHTDSSNSRRLRRRTPLDCSPTTSACCKQRFFVSFRALGWDDWIIAPSGYYANYCRGDCGGGPSGTSSRTPDTFLSYHSHVIDQVRKLPLQSQQLLASASSDERQQQRQLFASLQPCCAPTKFSSMSLIYFGPDMNIIKRDLPKMVVDECGCP